MKLRATQLPLWPTVVVAGFIFALAACDAVEPNPTPILVLEAFMESERNAPPVRLRQTLPVDDRYDDQAAAAGGASVRLHLPDRSLTYRESAAAGSYEASDPIPLSAGTPFTLEVDWRDQVATAQGHIPPAIRVARVEANFPDQPIEAVLLDSLEIDSLQTGARSGFVYPVQVEVWWHRPGGSANSDSLYWIRAQLRPTAPVAPGVVELIFRSGQILREDRSERLGELRKWIGYYLVTVDEREDPMPPHDLRVAILRSDEHYARFASSRTAPERREPISNVRGGIGIAAGISVDSLTVRVE